MMIAATTVADEMLPIMEYEDLILSREKAYKKISESPDGVILYKGKSLLDGERIVVIATGLKRDARNTKTGDMVQTWILRGEIPPLKAKEDGSDYSVCGDCKHRDIETCYVNLSHGPQQVYKASHDDNYPRFTLDMLELFRGKDIRLGSYGDPAAVPIFIWDTICSVANGWTGYTHQWGNTKLTNIKKLQKYCMASCDRIEEKRRALLLGWRTFRIKYDNTDNFVERDEFVCPASEEAGRVSNCAKCKGCSGLYRQHMRNVVIHYHQKGAKTFGKWGMKRIEWVIKRMRSKKGWKIDFEEVGKELKKVRKQLVSSRWT